MKLGSLHPGERFSQKHCSLGLCETEVEQVHCLALLWELPALPAPAGTWSGKGLTLLVWVGSSLCLPAPTP